MPNTPETFQPDAYAITRRGTAMPCRYVRTEEDGRSVVASPTGKEYSFDGEHLLSVEEAETQLRQNRAAYVAANYRFEVLHTDRRSTVVRCWNPAHPVRSNYTLTLTARRETCSCPAYLKSGGAGGCKHLDALRLHQQTADGAPAVPDAEEPAGSREFTSETW